MKGVPFLSNVFPVIHHKLFGEHHEYLLIGSTVYVVFPFRFLPMLYGEVCAIMGLIQVHY